MKIDTFEKFKNFVAELNKKGFQGNIYLDEVLDNTFIWEYNDTFKFQIIYDWYDTCPEFTIGCIVKYDDKILEAHWHIANNDLLNKIDRINNEGVVSILKKDIFNRYSIVSIMFINEYTDVLKKRYKDNFFNKYFEVFSKDK